MVMYVRGGVVEMAESVYHLVILCVLLQRWMIDIVKREKRTRRGRRRRRSE